MKSKPAPALLRPSNLSKEIKKSVPKPGETIPLKSVIILSFPKIPAVTEEGKICQLLYRNSIFGIKLGYLCKFQTFKKVRPLFGPFLVNQTKIRPQSFPAADNFIRPLLSSAAEISAPWQH
jgi:hypothetical protein